MSSAALIDASHSELLMLPSPHETNEMASRGQSPGSTAAAAGSRCSIASARPTACGPWLASVEVTRKSNLGSSPAVHHTVRWLSPRYKASAVHHTVRYPYPWSYFYPYLGSSPAVHHTRYAVRTARPEAGTRTPYALGVAP